MKDKRLLRCRKCKKKTLHIRRGFGTPGSICGNARDECLVCGEVH